VCEFCPPSQTPNMAQTGCINAFCSEFIMGEPGSYCPLVDGCNSTQLCLPCWPGSVAIYGINCTDCVEAGKVADTRHAACTSCPAAKEPEPHRDYCQNCTGNNYSTFGVACEPCSTGRKSDEAHVRCLDCTGGRGGAACSECTPQYYNFDWDPMDDVIVELMPTCTGTAIAATCDLDPDTDAWHPAANGSVNRKWGWIDTTRMPPQGCPDGCDEVIPAEASCTGASTTRLQCDLLAATDGTAACPSGCADVRFAAASSCTDTDATICTPGCTGTPSSEFKMCDLDAATDGTADCPFGCSDCADPPCRQTYSAATRCEVKCLGTSTRLYTCDTISATDGTRTCPGGCTAGTDDSGATCTGTSTQLYTCDLRGNTDKTSVCPEGCEFYTATDGAIVQPMCQHEQHELATIHVFFLPFLLPEIDQLPFLLKRPLTPRVDLQACVQLLRLDQVMFMFPSFQKLINSFPSCNIP
jgi:hypothetical protein